MIGFEQARAIIFEQVRALDPRPAVERVGLHEAVGRILAEDVVADRDYPPFNRSARDGYAVRSADVAQTPARIKVVGSTRAGEPSRFTLGAGEAVEIMTGAPGPAGADAVVMVERTRREGDEVVVEEGVAAGRNLIPSGSEARAGAVVLGRGRRLEYPSVALAASVGAAQLTAYRRPEVAVLSTGDEVVPLESTPRPFQIRNSNAASLAAQVVRRGGRARLLDIAPDEAAATRRLIEAGLRSDILVLSGGVSMGKHDVVEAALADLGARFFITEVAIQPGKPFVFAVCRGKPVFGLPGNPISTMVTFEIFARLAVDLFAGAPDSPLPFHEVPLAADFRHKPVLTRFLPARLEGSGPGARVEAIQWRGSGDLVSAARADLWLVAAANRSEWKAGETISVLPL